MRKTTLFPFSWAIVFVFMVSFAQADVKLPAIIGDNMVLQRDQENRIWGWADAGEEITVSIDVQKKTCETGADGKWSLTLDPLTAGGPYDLIVKGKNELKLQNVMIGEVWLCSGQSNMQWSVNNCDNAKQEIASADYPNIRLITVPRVSSRTPKDDFNGSWSTCTPQSVPGFSGVGYFFGRKLHKELDGMAIGLINCSWGGSSCETWINPDIIAAEPDYAQIMKRKSDYEEKNPDKGDNQQAGYLYNGMIVPVKNYGIRGAIWYQGETNAGRAFQYRTLFPCMIENWRKEWNQGDFPFYFVQLANYRAINPESGESAWAELREAQSMTRKLKNAGEAVIIDIGDEKDIHPRNKQDVGLRLALIALAKDYGMRELVHYGPVYKSMKIEGNKIVLEFDHIGSGLIAGRNIYCPNDGTFVTKTGNGSFLQGFSIAGEDKKFVWAGAKIQGNKIEVTAKDVPNPVAVRYAWADNPICNLYNVEGLPATPFRTDEWPGVTVNNK